MNIFFSKLSKTNKKAELIIGDTWPCLYSESKDNCLGGNKNERLVNLNL